MASEVTDSTQPSRIVSPEALKMEPKEENPQTGSSPASLETYNSFLGAFQTAVDNIPEGDPDNRLPGLLFFLDPYTLILDKLDRMLINLHNAVQRGEITEQARATDSIQLELLRLWLLVLGPGKTLTDPKEVPDSIELQNIIDAIQIVRTDNDTVTRIRNSLVNLGAHCLVKFFETGDIVYLDATIVVRFKLLTFNLNVPTNADDESLLCTLLTRKFLLEPSPSLNTINEAIDHGRAAIQLAPLNQNKSMHLSNLSSALYQRYMRYEMDDDIHAAVALAKTAIEAAVRDNESTQLLDNNHATMLSDLAEKQGASREDVASSIELVRGVFAETPREDPSYLLRKFNLGVALTKMYLKVHDEKYISEGIAILEDLLGEKQNLNVELRLSVQVNLMNAYFLHYRVRKALDALDKVTQQGEAILNQALPSAITQSQHDMVQSVLSQAYYYKFAAHGHQQDLNVAIAYFEDGKNAALPIQQMALTKSIFLARIYATQGRQSEAMDQYRQVLRDFPQYVMLGMEYRMDLATFWEDLGPEAAAIFARGSRLAEALEALELGRSLAWTRGVQLRSQIDGLEADHPEHAERFRKLSEALNKPDVDSNVDLPSDATGITATAAEKKFSLSQEWDTLLGDIRQLDRYENFLRTPSYDEMRLLASTGPVVVINVHHFRSDAFLLTTASFDRPQIVRLGVELDKEVRRWTENLLDGVRKVEEGEMTEKQFGRIIFAPILKEVWQQIMQPIRDSLSALEPYARRVWLCPTGQLTFLPLHCVIDGLSKSDSHQYLPLVPSYTPTLATLLRGRSKAVPQTETAVSILAASCASVAGFDTIANAKEEVETIRHLCTSSQMTVLDGANTTKEAVLKGMEENSWLHLACHGIPSSDDPYSSHFVLSDGPLYLSDIVAARLEKPSFAFLSACHTATGVPSLSNEAMHLAAGLHFAGYQAVIATMWPVDDKVAKRLAKVVYKSLFDRGDGDGKPQVEETAEVLWKAIKLLRSKNVPMSLLAPFIHSGV